MVTCARARDAAHREIEHQALKRHEHASWVLLQQFVVELTQDLREGLAVPRQAAQERHRHRHEERGGNAFARDVTQRHEHAVGVEPQDLEEIAADLTGRLERRMHVQSRSLDLRRDIRRQEAHLDLARDEDFPLRRCLHGLCVRLRLQQRTDAGLDLQHLERLGQVVVAADLEAAGLVVHVLERAEKHDRQLAGRLRGAQPSADLVAVDIRHDDVEQNQVGRAPLHGVERLLAAESNRELVLTAERAGPECRRWP